eukprot:CAMPEP_0170501924 /NCGR_PEP_ID=MMETSP0208-20121228/39882_1 /TAXON_ID=197538 /ORGANISM="Strombidium inclinatum, Strain S3" /LENGTH=56 /DNA_ID=CAMNT_0010780717 /DNA_START=300 /DNA_END=470 /DNA_ORIENTATION=-
MGDSDLSCDDSHEEEEQEAAVGDLGIEAEGMQTRLRPLVLVLVLRLHVILELPEDV